MMEEADITSAAEIGVRTQSYHETIGTEPSNKYIAAGPMAGTSVASPTSPTPHRVSMQTTLPASSDPKKSFKLQGYELGESETDAPKGDSRLSKEQQCYQSHVPNLSLKQLENYLKEHDHQADHDVWHWIFKMLILLFSVAAVMAIVIVLFGVIPLGEPNTESKADKMVWIFATNALTYTCLNLLIYMIFFAVLNEATPWHDWKRYLPIFFGSYLPQCFVMGVIYPFTDGTFPFMGIIPLVTSFLMAYIILKTSKGRKWSSGSWCNNCSYYDDQLSAFICVVIALFLYIIVLNLWLLAYRESDSVGQALLPFVLLALVFGWKKYLLAKTDHFPIVIAMLISGFWIENLDDMFQTMIFPSVDDEATAYIALWLRKFGENIAYLIFLTDTWFRFRVWIKDFFKHLVHKNLPHAKPINEDIDELDRGHSNIKPAYWRRQVQFLMYKIISQCVSYIIYLAITPQLRDDKSNGNFYPFQKSSSAEQNLDSESYENSLVFAAVSFITTATTGFVAFWIVRKYRTETYHQIIGRYGQLFRRPKYYGFMFLIILSNTLVAFSALQYHNRLWYFQEDQVPQENE